MRKLLRLLGIVIGALAALVIVLLIGIVLFFDPNDYKDRIAGYVSDQTGREVGIEGAIELTYFPWLGVSFGPVQLGQPARFGDEPMLRVERAGASVKLLPLVTGDIQIGTVSLHGFDLTLMRTSDGVTNWQDLLAAEEQPAEPTAELPLLSIGELDAADGRVVWDDRQAGQRLVAEALTLSSGPIAFGKPFEIEATGRLMRDQPRLEADIEVGARALIAPGGRQLSLDGLDLTVTGESGPPGEAMPLDLQLYAAAEADLDAGTFALNKLETQAYDIAARGRLEGSGLAGTLAYRGNLEVSEFVPRRTFEALGLAVPETSDPDVLQRARAQVELEGRGQRLDLTLSEARLDDTVLSGDVSVEMTDPAGFGFNLDLNGIDVDRYLPPAADTTEDTAPAPEAAPSAPPTALPVAQLRGLRIDGKLVIGRIKIANINATDIQVAIRSDGQNLRVNPLQASFYEGRYDGDMRLDLTKDPPVLSMSETLSDVQAGPLFTDAFGSPYLTGRGGIQINTQAAVANEQMARETLSGNIAMDFRDGAIQGLNVLAQIRQAKARLEGQALSAEAASRTTDFAELRLAADVDQGVARVRELLLRSPLLRITGGGSIDLGAQQVDLLVKPVLVKTVEGQGGIPLADLQGVPLPLRIKGPLAAPSTSLDIAAAITESQKQRIKETVGRKVGEEVGGEMGERIKGLLGGQREQPPGQKADKGQAEPEKQKSDGDRIREGMRSLFGGDKDKPKDEDEDKDGGGG